MPYRCALYRGLARRREIEWTVLFLDRWGYEQRYDPTMNATYSWGDDTLTGFDYKFLTNKGRFTVTYTGADKTEEEERKGAIGAFQFYLRTYFGLFTPEVVNEVWNADATVIIVENYSSVSSVVAAIVGRLSGKKVYLRGEATLRPEQTWVLRFAKRLYLGLLFPVYSGFMYSCAANREFYLAHGAPQRKLVFVPSAVDSAVFGRIQSDARLTLRNHLRAKYGIPSSAIVVLGIGRLVPRKNWREAIEAFFDAQKRSPSLVLVLIGDGPSRVELERLVPDGVSNSVHFLGFKSQSEIAELYFIGDMLVQSSLYDPSPKVLNEALLADLPLVVSDRIGTAGDVCVHEENGFIYSSGKPADLSEKILALALDDGLRRRFSATSARLAKLWSIDAGVQNIINAIEESAGSTRGTSDG